ncbi:MULTISPECIES: 50S ribosomal protein L4 [Kyrpidia]|uniref:Large ribosomal subunit protein uL4 n=2 Tax=Kyrpidia spormannii TaxID=2055160 RepID=A0A6F9DYZ6_9BACL|nr:MULTISPECIES: 50S ribosomal protein L4 [Kyrpidia]MCL6575346.1 50S ribosomal protein L4 [Kyrpidia sp.]CAB3389333.1 ribosomal protein L4 [Kyrpidia spormannii]CAB3389933.1 ribosomal protein L4 [Kyrpidia spormannii]
MPKVAVYNAAGEQVGELELSEKVFGVDVKPAVLHQAVVAQLANARQGTRATKNRALVRGGGRKPWRQKGTGRARQGSIRAPQWVGGGTVFGPQPRDFSMRLPKKLRRLAIRGALSSKVSEGSLIVLDSLPIEAPKTKEMIRILSNLKVPGKALVVGEGLNQPAYLSARNIPGVKYLPATDINVVDLLHHDHLVVTTGAVKRIEEVFA